MSSRTTGTGYGSGVGRGSSSVTASQRKHRSRSTPRYADLEKPKKKKNLSGTTSLVSIPNTIKLSMLNSGLISFEIGEIRSCVTQAMTRRKNTKIKNSPRAVPNFSIDMFILNGKTE